MRKFLRLVSLLAVLALGACGGSQPDDAGGLSAAENAELEKAAETIDAQRLETEAALQAAP